MKYSIFIDEPKDFHPTIEVASCYCESQDKILLVKRHPEKPQGNTWGVPAGKLEKNETPLMAVIREVKEEVGLNIEGVELIPIGKLYGRLPHVDYVYHMFKRRFQETPEVDLAFDEHLEFKWVTFDEALKLPLIIGGEEALYYYRDSR